MKRPKPPEGRYSKVTRRIWGSPDFRALSGPSKPNAQHMFFRFLSGPELGVVPGLFVLRLGGLADEFNWPLAGTRKCLQEIIARGMANYDANFGLVWVPKAINHNAPDNPNVVLGWRAAWKELPECPLKEVARAELLEWFVDKSAVTKNADWLKAFAKASDTDLPTDAHDPVPNVEEWVGGRVTPNPSQGVTPNHDVDPPPNPFSNPLGNQEQEQDQEQDQDPKPPPNSNAAAYAHAKRPEPLLQRDAVGFVDPRSLERRALWILGRMQDRQGGTGAYNFGVFRDELYDLARKDPAEMERALRTYETDPYVLAHRAVCTPTNLLKRFEGYVVGNPSGRLNGPVRAKPLEDADVIDELGVM